LEVVMKGSSFVMFWLWVAVCAASLASLAHADGPPPLPPEAYAACQSKAEGDACTVEIHDREVHGKCAPDREGKGLFCRPDEMPFPPPPRPEGAGK
jgi:hypothetical protein